MKEMNNIASDYCDKYQYTQTHNDYLISMIHVAILQIIQYTWGIALNVMNTAEVDIVIKFHYA